jgi:hypothetical protein
LIDNGHQVVSHARSKDRADAVGAIARRSAAIVVGDLHSAAETRAIADQVNSIGDSMRSSPAPASARSEVVGLRRMIARVRGEQAFAIPADSA